MIVKSCQTLDVSYYGIIVAVDIRTNCTSRGTPIEVDDGGESSITL